MNIRQKKELVLREQRIGELEQEAQAHFLAMKKYGEHTAEYTHHNIKYYNCVYMAEQLRKERVR
jgi:hypothetical protein